jgi:hypothetical protein
VIAAAHDGRERARRSRRPSAFFVGDEIAASGACCLQLARVTLNKENAMTRQQDQWGDYEDRRGGNGNGRRGRMIEDDRDRARDRERQQRQEMQYGPRDRERWFDDEDRDRERGYREWRSGEREALRDDRDLGGYGQRGYGQSGYGQSGYGQSGYGGRGEFDEQRWFGGQRGGDDGDRVYGRGMGATGRDQGWSPYSQGRQDDDEQSNRGYGPPQYGAQYGGFSDRFEGGGGRQRSGMQRNFVGKGPKGYTKSDERISEQINERLSEGYLDASEIEVQVNNGEVVLSGTVRERNDRRLAEDLIEDVSGVKDVENRIKVKRDDGDRDRQRGESSVGESRGIGAAGTMPKSQTRPS